MSQTLQGKCSASEGQKVAEMTKKTLFSMRNEQNFDFFWVKVGKMTEDVDVGDTVLPRRRKMPKKFEDRAPPEFPSSAKDMYRQVYFEAHYLLVQAIEDRFNQQDYKTYCCLEE